MRVVETDNFGGDYPNEKFCSESVTEEEAKIIANNFNKDVGDYSTRYWIIVPDDYILKPGFEP